MHSYMPVLGLEVIISYATFLTILEFLLTQPVYSFGVRFLLFVAHRMYTTLDKQLLLLCSNTMHVVSFILKMQTDAVAHIICS